MWEAYELTKAPEHLERAAVLGKVQAQHLLGQKLLQADPAANHDAAVRWFRMAADNFHRPSQRALALLGLGEEWGEDGGYGEELADADAATATAGEPPAPAPADASGEM